MTTPALAGTAATGSGQYAAEPLDRLVRKEVSLGAIREIPPPMEHIGLNLVPWKEVATDDVIFEYLKDGLQDGLAPARAEDAEAELSQKDDFAAGMGRASIIDWSLMDKYTASDVTRYRNDLRARQQLEGIIADLPLSSVGNSVAEFQSRVARDDAMRKRKLDNRIEWLIQNALWNNQIGYNDGKIKFTVTYGRPSDQSSITPLGGLWTPANSADADPIGAVKVMNQEHYDKYGVYLKRAFTSEKALQNLYQIKRFRDAALFAAGVRTSDTDFDVNYIGGLSNEWALSLLRNGTNMEWTTYDSVYRTRPIGSQTTTNVRFSPEDHVLFLPNEADLGEIDDTELGFGKTLTSPHPEGNWQSGFYEWEQEKRNPWLHEKGSGVKAFPVLPYMKYTRTMKVL